MIVSSFADVNAHWAFSKVSFILPTYHSALRACSILLSKVPLY